MVSLMTADRLLLSSIAVLVLELGCGERSDAQVDEDVRPAETETLDDTNAAEVFVCVRDLDCAPFAGCCLDLACEGGQCVPRYVADCCVQPGSCAVATPLHRAECRTACAPYGCEPRLVLGAERCGDTPWKLDLTPVGVSALSLAPPNGPADRVLWHLSPLRRFDGHPALRAGDILCPTTHVGPHDPTCTPLGAGSPLRLAFDTPPFALPADVATVVELALWVDLSSAPTTAETIAGLELMAVDEGGASTLLWSSRPPTSQALRPFTPLPQRRWTPRLVDLSLFAGRSIRLRAIFDSPDARARGREGVSIGRLKVRTACTADLEPTDPTPCAQPAAVAVHPVATTLYVPMPPEDAHVNGCAPCTRTLDCPPTTRCTSQRCEAGRCLQETFADCCESTPSWPFSPAFSELETTGPWRAATTDDAEPALVYATEDGLAPAGEASAGEARTGPLRLPESDPIFSFSLALSTEWDVAPSNSNPAGVDLLEVLIWLDDAPTLPPTTVWTSTRIGGTTLGQTRRMAIDLSPWRGRNVRIGWRFQTGDAEANAGGSVVIGRPLVRRECPDCTASDEAAEVCEPAR
jgi:hypothetical protein